MKPPVGMEIYRDHFPLTDKFPEGGDDNWLSQIGSWGWVVLTQDYKMHKRVNELFAIKQYGIGLFYLWGCEYPTWDIMRCFVSGFNRIVEAAEYTPKPFIYRVTKTGQLESISLP